MKFNRDYKSLRNSFGILSGNTQTRKRILVQFFIFEVFEGRANDLYNDVHRTPEFIEVFSIDKKKS